ncbi:hypothetical protein [uncultured Pseudoalteromonas sp.]|uniref:hypothetical protein n=1 Tax=uncultured Pseudoalteromonas sp. TaxID=114053 RepID=UPI0030C7C005
MNKTHIISVLFGLFLVACSKQPTPFESYDVAQVSIKNLNSTLKNTNSDHVLQEQVFPFSLAYLSSRHEIYQRLQTMALSKAQMEQLNYLIIAERFPERFFSWPAQINVLENVLVARQGKASYKDVIDWLEFTQNQLESALQSNLRLNKVELDLLKGYLKTSLLNIPGESDLKAQVAQFSGYLAQYKPRGSIGLRGLANGSEWYQSKLNYFSGEVKSPLQWVEKINQYLQATPATVANFEYNDDHSSSFVSQYLSDAPKVSGLDWHTEYMLLPVMANKILLSPKDKKLMLALMETDIGIHYHAWTLSQAKVNLVKRLAISERDAQYLVEDSVLYPAHAFSFAEQLLTL